MASIFMVLFLIANIVWTILNWKDEVDAIKITWATRRSPNYVGGFDINTKMWTLMFLFLDVFLTSAATTLFGFGAGIFGAAATIFMSNLISHVFLVPKGSLKSAVKELQKREKTERRALA